MPSNRSRTIAIDSTMPAAAPSPWTNRSAVSASTDVTKTMPIEASDVQAQPGEQRFAPAHRVGDGPDQQLTERQTRPGWR